MLIDATDYMWMKTEIEDVGVGEEPLIYEPESPLRIYRMECGEYGGSVLIKESEDAEECIYEGMLPYEPDAPIAFDSIVISADEPFGGLHMIGEEGTLKIVLSPYMDTTEGMEYIHDGYNDDGTYSTAGLEGFLFNGISVSTVYLSGNHWIGFGVQTEQLRILRRDGCSTALLRQTGDCGKDLSFLKLRFEGYTVYSNRVEANRLVFELFLLSNNDMFLNVIQTPTSGNTGDSSLVCSGGSVPLTLFDGQGGGALVTFRHTDDEGKQWDVAYEPYSQEEYTKAYLVESGGVLYAAEEEGLVEVDAELSALTFLLYGTEEPPPSELLIGLENPEILYWISDTASEMVRADVTAYPYPQTLEAVADMSHISIIGIKMVTADYSGDVRVSYSPDSGRNFTDEIPLADFLNLDAEELYEGLSEEKVMVLRFVLHDNASLSRFKITYRN